MKVTISDMMALFNGISLWVLQKMVRYAFIPHNLAYPVLFST